MNNMIKNGVGSMERGYRQICFTPSGEVRQVCKADRKGQPYKQTTYQAPQLGDIVLGVQWYPQTAYGRKMTEEGLVDLTHDELRAEPCATILRDMPQELRDWLMPVHQQSSYLPDGYGWTDGLTTHSLRKKADIAEFFHGCGDEWLEKLWVEARVTPFFNIPQKWLLAQPMPQYTDNHVIEESTSFYTVRQYVQWVLWRTDGHVDVFTPPASIRDISGTLPMVVPEYSESPPMAMPLDVVRAARIVRGALRDPNGNSFGCTWTLHAY